MRTRLGRESCRQQTNAIEPDRATSTGFRESSAVPALAVINSKNIIRLNIEDSLRGFESMTDMS